MKKNKISKKSLSPKGKEESDFRKTRMKQLPKQKYHHKRYWLEDEQDDEIIDYKRILEEE